MFKRILLFSTTLLLLLSFGLSSMNTGAQSDQANAYLPLVNNGPSKLYLPLVMKPWLNSTFGVEVSNLDETAAMRALETKNAWVRINALDWSGYQPNNSSEFLTNAGLEQELINANKSGMKAILIIHKTPSWARKFSDSVCGPVSQEKFGEFANFMSLVVQRYSQAPFNVTYYELGNEPELPIVRGSSASNIVFGCWGDDSQQFFGGGYYGEMLKIVAPAMRAVNPNAKIVLGGLLLDCDPLDPGDKDYTCKDETKRMSGFFEGILQAGAGSYFDVVNYHAYNYYNRLSPIKREYEIPNWAKSGGQVEGKLAFLKQVMGNYGIDKPVILTEAGLICPGCSTLPTDYEQAKAEYIVWLYTRNWSKGILATTWYTLDKGGWRGTGLLDAKNIPTPAFYAYKNMTTMLHGANFTREVNIQDGARIFEFDKGYKVWVLFSMDGNSKTIDLSSYGPTGNIEAYDLYGNLCDGTNCSLQGSLITYDLPIFLQFHN